MLTKLHAFFNDKEFLVPFLSSTKLKPQRDALALHLTNILNEYTQDISATTVRAQLFPPIPLAPALTPLCFTRDRGAPFAAACCQRVTSRAVSTAQGTMPSSTVNPRPWTCSWRTHSTCYYCRHAMPRSTTQHKAKCRSLG